MLNLQPLTNAIEAIATPLFKPGDDLKLVPKASPDGKFVKESSNGVFQTQPSGALVSQPNVKDDNGDLDYSESIVYGNEEDISARLGSTAKAIYTLPLGIVYPDESMGVAFNFRDAIVEYRSNVGVQSKKASLIANRAPTYGVTYVSVGIPVGRYEWIRTEVLEATGFALTSKPKVAPHIHSGYAWFTANISENADPKVYVVGDDKSYTFKLKDLLIASKQSIIGVMCASASLKRVMEGSGMTYGLTLSFKSIQCVDFTTISSPPLGNTVDYIADSSAKASSGLWSTVLKSMNADKEGVASASKAIVPTPANP